MTAGERDRVSARGELEAGGPAEADAAGSLRAASAEAAPEWSGPGGRPRPVDFRWGEVWHPHVLMCSVVLYLAGVLCSAAGIGGGGVYVAVLMIAGGLSPRDAVPLSKSVVFFGAVSSLMVNLRVQDPWGHSGRSVIDLQACQVVVPAALCGTYLGVLLNWVSNDAVIVLVLSVLLVFMTAMVVRTAWQQHVQEEQEESEGRVATDAATGAGPAWRSAGGPPRKPAAWSPQDDDGGVGANNASAPGCGGGTSADPHEDEDERDAAEGAPLLGRRAVDRRDVGPSRVDLSLAAALIFVVVASGVSRYHMHQCRTEKELVLSGGEVPQWAACAHPVATFMSGGRMDLLMSDRRMALNLQNLAVSLPMCACAAVAAYYTGRLHKLERWPVRRVLAYQATALSTGALAGLAGIGGGLILSPFFLLTGMDAAVAVGTSSTCVLFVAASTTFQYVLTDRVIFSLSMVYGLVTFVASSSGTSLVLSMQRSGRHRKSRISCMVAAGVALSAVLSLVKLAKELSS